MMDPKNQQGYLSHYAKILKMEAVSIIMDTDIRDSEISKFSNKNRQRRQHLRQNTHYVYRAVPKIDGGEERNDSNSNLTTHNAYQDEDDEVDIYEVFDRYEAITETLNSLKTITDKDFFKIVSLTLSS